jgi:hypothetical protein
MWRQLERALEANQTVALEVKQTASPPVPHAQQRASAAPSHSGARVGGGGGSCKAADEAGGARGKGARWWGEEERWSGAFHCETGLLFSSPLCGDHLSSPLSGLVAMKAEDEGEEEDTCEDRGGAGGKRVRIAHGHVGLVNDLNALRLDLLRLNLAGLSSCVSLSSHLVFDSMSQCPLVCHLYPPCCVYLASCVSYRISGLRF